MDKYIKMCTHEKGICTSTTIAHNTYQFVYLVKSMVTDRGLCWPIFEAASFVDVADDCTCR